MSTMDTRNWYTVHSTSAAVGAAEASRPSEEKEAPPTWGWWGRGGEGRVASGGQG